MNKKALTSILLVVAAYTIVLIAAVGITIALAEKITAQLVLSWVFIGLPYAVLCGSNVLTMIDKENNVMQNGMLTTMAGAYLALAVVVTILLNLLALSLKPFIIIEIIIMVIGVVVIIVGLLAKTHIESVETKGR